jgi:hypothetical protein
MTKTKREQVREEFLALLDHYGLTRADAAELLHSSIPPDQLMCKPETSKSSNPVPMWAIEMLTHNGSKRRKNDHPKTTI